jgi:hypothetical protein
MLGRGKRGLLVAATVGMLAVAATQPALGYELGHTGTVGVHSLVDTSANPGATGKYRYYASDGFGWLKRFWVNPPKMRAVAGKTNQTVGWKFIVERKVCGIPRCGRWTVRYTSPEMTAVTDDAHNASFSQATVRVRVPCGHNCEDAGAIYRITVKMLWHRPNGSIQGKVKDRIYWYGAQMTNGDSGVQEKVASDAWSPDW